MMNEQAMNVAIAEACGWRFEESMAIRPDGWRMHSCINNPKGEFTPNYTGDLNAMHEAGLWMESNATSKCDIYATQLSYVINPKNGQVGDFRYLHATAHQRAEAFLRACGKWVEE